MRFFVALAVIAISATAGAEPVLGQTTVRLAPAPSQLRQSCTNAAHRLGVVIYCPKRVPAGWSLASVCEGCHRLRLFSATGWFPAPKGYAGQPGEPTGHFNLWAATKHLARLGYVGCGGSGTRAGPARIATLRATWIVCPEGSSLDGGHIVLQWWIRDWTYGFSLHGNTPVNRRLLRAIAAQLVPVRG